MTKEQIENECIKEFGLYALCDNAIEILKLFYESGKKNINCVIYELVKEYFNIKKNEYKNCYEYYKNSGSAYLYVPMILFSNDLERIVKEIDK